MRYALARWRLYIREEAYRIYVTDSLKVFGKLDKRYIDYFKPEETRTADEVINKIRAGLMEIGGQDELI